MYAVAVRTCVWSAAANGFTSAGVTWRFAFVGGFCACRDCRTIVLLQRRWASYVIEGLKLYNGCKNFILYSVIWFKDGDHQTTSSVTNDSVRFSKFNWMRTLCFTFSITRHKQILAMFRRPAFNQLESKNTVQSLPSLMPE